MENSGNKELDKLKLIQVRDGIIYILGREEDEVGCIVQLSKEELENKFLQKSYEVSYQQINRAITLLQEAFLLAPLLPQYSKLVQLSAQGRLVYEDEDKLEVPMKLWEI